jgi:hypothetical protein
MNGCTGSSMAERHGANVEAAGSIPARCSGVSRSDNSIGRVPVFQTGDAGSIPAHCMKG